MIDEMLHFDMRLSLLDCVTGNRAKSSSAFKSSKTMIVDVDSGDSDRGPSAEPGRTEDERLLLLLKKCGGFEAAGGEAQQGGVAAAVARQEPPRPGRGAAPRLRPARG